jgi:pseudaminic acid cytidylyltransferase
MNIAIIPARGGSKRVPRKNIKLFHGLPIISYAIATAAKASVFDEIIVSTEDLEIAEIARQFGATTPWVRSKSLAGDSVSTLRVLQEEVKNLESKFGRTENVCCIYPATPLLEPASLLMGLQILETSNWDYVISAVKNDMTPQRSFTLGESANINLLLPQYEFTRTQDLEISYHDAGQFYWGKKTSWTSGRPFFSSNSTIVELPKDSAVDIDTLDDWHYAEKLFLIHKEGKV